MNTVLFKIKKETKTPWERRYQLALNNILFGKPKKRSTLPYFLIIVFILLLGFVFN
ncbi:MAG TPA: hypothetical protein VKZ51_08940 [Cyclobacteriaceae bacterium]|nr:hypothetical protein [Cyclobacteriaceae bacterium]